MPNNVNASPSVAVPNLPNPYTLQYLKNLMNQPRPFVGTNLTYPYPPIAYQPLPMLPQVCYFYSLLLFAIFCHSIFVLPPLSFRYGNNNNITNPNVFYRCVFLI